MIRQHLTTALHETSERAVERVVREGFWIAVSRSERAEPTAKTKVIDLAAERLARSR